MNTGDTSRFPRSVPRQPHSHAPQNTAVLPAAANGQLEDHREDMPYLVGGFAGPGRLQDPHHVNIVNHGTVDYRPLPINDPAVPYVCPDVGPQGITTQGQLNVPGNQEYDHFGYTEHVAHGLGLAPTQAPFPHPFLYRVPTTLGTDNIRRFASRYLHHPNSRVNVVHIEPGTADRFRVIIILDVSDVQVLGGCEYCSYGM